MTATSWTPATTNATGYNPANYLPAVDYLGTEAGLILGTEDGNYIGIENYLHTGTTWTEA